ncbi:zinc finger protein 91-like [Centroberyx affinis]|uniref:zinc finger protein 91-like n=1 Tax=Centroberyx affinis TaxID=166261 RepID=UPI003A5C02EE
MDINGEQGVTEALLPLSALRLLVSPVQLLSAAVWKITQNGDVMDFRKLEEFVTSVTETVPELLSFKLKTQLIMGLRAKLVLEMCRTEQMMDHQTIQTHLDRIRVTSLPPREPESCEAELEASVSNFLALVQTLLADPVKREHFFQEVFPVEYGPKYDSALRELMWEFLSRLAQLLPVPDLKQTACWLSAAPAVLEECVKSSYHTKQWDILLKHHQNLGHLSTNGTQSTSIGDHIFSSLSRGAGKTSTNTEIQSDFLNDSVLYAQELETEPIVMAGFAQVDLATSMYTSEGIELRMERRTEMQETENSASVEAVCGEMGVVCERLESVDGAAQIVFQEVKYNQSVKTEYEESLINVKNTDMHLIKNKSLPEAQQVKENGTEGSDEVKDESIPISKSNLGGAVEPAPLVFACSQISFGHAEELGLRKHVKEQHSEEYNRPLTTENSKTELKTVQTPCSKTCPVCGKTFSRASDMRRHQKSHTGVRPYKCLQCGKTFVHSYELKRHQRKCSRPFQYYKRKGCDQSEDLKANCSVVQPTEASPSVNESGNRLNLQTNMEGSIEDGCGVDGLHKCLKCNMSFSESSLLRQHELTHSDYDPLRCNHCLKTYQDTAAFIEHMHIHNQEQLFPCSVCKMNFKQLVCLRQHYLKSHKKEGSFLCSQCPKGFSTLSNLIKHQKTHTGERPYQCSHCPKTFTHLTMLTRHERIHSGERPFLCPECGKGFLCSGGLSKHLHCHSEERPFSCPQCDKTFKAKQFLKSHLKTHTEDRPFCCSFCGKRFAMSQYLTRHNRIHTGERPYLCSECGKSFLTSGEVTKHRRYHTGERPFKCTQCGKTFTQSCQLTEHMRIHTGERPYGCILCGKHFTNTVGLRRHMRTHTGEKPFVCSICGKSLKAKYLLQAHEKSHTLSLPLSSLRLLVPPLRLLSAAMWQVAKQKDVMNYEKLQEFVFMVTEAVPGLINHRQRAQLILGLRARTAAWLGSAPSVLEECVQSTPEELSLIYQHHRSSGLLKMPYGPSSTIGTCIMSALSIPPSQKTTTSVGLESMHNYANILNPIAFVGADQYSVVTVYTEVEVEVGASEVGEEIVESTEEVQVQTDFYEAEIVAVSEDNTGGRDVESVSSKTEETSETVDIAKALETLTKTFALRKEALDQDVPTGKINDSNTESLNDEMETESATDEGRTHEASEQIDEQTENRKVDLQPGGTERNTNSESYTQLKDEDESCCVSQEMADASCEVPVSQAQQSTSSASVRRSSRLQMKTSPSWQETCKFKNSSKENNGEPKMNKADVSIAPSVIAIKGIDTDESGEMTSIIFTCPQCPFHNSDENSPPHIHMQSVRTEEYRTLMAAKQEGAEFTPSPCSTDQIFTSIKLFPKGNTEQNRVEEPDSQSIKENTVNVSQSQGKRKALTCETCGKTFTRTSDVRRHQLTHTGERPFHCSQCDRTFQHSWDLAKHENKHHGAAISFSCQLCRNSFTNLRALTVHHKKAHSGESQLPQICSICSQSFPSSSELLEHRKSHGSSQRYICQQCGEGFDSLLARSQHRQTHQVKRQFKCPHCDKTYTRRSDVKRHLATHTGERPYQCNQCSKRFSLRFMLMKHLHVHTGERPFQCSHCPKRFTLVSILARHERMHTGEKPFLCSQCGKGFLSQGELSKHHRSHVDDRPYSCTQCDKRFKSKKTQQEHIFSHTGARPYPCTYCGKGFTKPYALTRHNLIHTGERPFPCGHCEKTFLTLSEAQLHQRIHTGERPYPCTMCELKFKSSSELARHKRSHLGMKPLKPYCEQCMKTFTSKAKLRKHMETHREEGEAGQSLDSEMPEES